jgi:hypothetical protein
MEHMLAAAFGTWKPLVVIAMIGGIGAIIATVVS